jgi:uncharacterized repeat protein (TIGR03943 family)
MNAPLRRILFSTAVLSWSAALLYFHASGRINKYLAPDFRIIALLGGLGLAVLGCFNILTASRLADCGHDHGDDGDPHDHEGQDGNPWISMWLMVVPLVLAVCWTKDAYSADTLSRKGLYDAPSDVSSLFLSANIPPLTREYIEKNHDRSEDGYYDFNLMELFFATGDREMQSVIDGMKVETEGRWVEEKANNPKGTRKRLYRLFMTCCIADSRAVPVILEFGKEPPNFPDNDWVRVSGTMRFPLEEGTLQAVIMVDHVIAANPPVEESFLRK